jgi:hypothetical protein
MSENRSLDDFFSSSDEDSGTDEHDADGDSDPDTHGDDAPDDEAVGDEDDVGGPTAASATPTDADGPVDPLRATYRWSPDGDDCPACGRRVERRWRDGDRFVCADCKEW